MKNFLTWMSESITQDVISHVYDFLKKHSYMDDEFDVRPLAQELGITPVELERIIGLINQRLQKSDSGQEFHFNPWKMTVWYSYEDV